MSPEKGRHSKVSGPEIQNASAKGSNAACWYVYMVTCADHSLYTGVTTDVDRRVDEHNKHNSLGAAYTRARRPVTLVYKEAVVSRSSALKREHEIRQLSSQAKKELLNCNQ